MKLSTLAISVAVIIGAAATGGSWYTGKQVEQRYGELVNQANSSLKTLKIYGIEAELKEVKVERGWFSSDVSYNLEAKVDSETFQFKGSDKLFHGPFPLNRLTKGNILPAMVSVESHIAVPDNLKMLFAKTELLNAQTDISYAENFSGKLAIAGLKTADSQFELSDIASEFDLNKAGEGKLNAKLPSLKISDDTKMQFIIEQAEYEMDLKGKSDYELLSVGDFKLQAKSYVLNNTEDNSQLSIKDIHSKGYAKITDGVYESGADFAGNVEFVMKENRQEFGKLKADMFMAMDAKATNTFMSFTSSPEKIQSPEAADAAMALLDKPLKFHIKNFSLENAKGKGQLDLVLNTDGFKPENMSGSGNLLDLFKQLKFETTLNIAFLEQWFKQLASLNPQTAANAETLAQQNVAEIVSQAKASDIAVVDGENIKLKLEIDQGKVKLNGNDVPDEQVQSALFMLMLGLGGMWH